MSDAVAAAPEIAFRSTLYEKLPAELRRDLDAAIVNRDLPKYRDLYTTFDLARYGVSFSAVFRYARRLRAWGRYSSSAFTLCWRGILWIR